MGFRVLPPKQQEATKTKCKDRRHADVLHPLSDTGVEASTQRVVTPFAVVGRPWCEAKYRCSDGETGFGTTRRSHSYRRLGEPSAQEAAALPSSQSQQAQLVIVFSVADW